eukprot:TRINITY_DN693_c0_g1_i2.p1 TRINITY_DN693_c0_g1~~TRINITY_DN693_c0_g1_i2.p1  ORF type:complete len:142 (+),score=44.57 TRINITY_DN693_c0_g1_i2:623-1048(+)
MVPSVSPTNLAVEVPAVAIVRFKQVEGVWKVAHEHIYWDQASVLVQLGLLSPDQFDVTGVEQARKVRNQTDEPSNQLLQAALVRRDNNDQRHQVRDQAHEDVDSDADEDEDEDEMDDEDDEDEDDGWHEEDDRWHEDQDEM